MSQTKQFTKEYEKLLILPVSKEDVENALLNLEALFSFYKILKTSGGGSDVEVQWVYKPSVISSKKLVLKVKSRKARDDTVVIEGVSEDMDFTVNCKILQVFYAVHTSIKVVCKGVSRDICDKFFTPILDELREYIVKTPKEKPIEQKPVLPEKKAVPPPPSPPPPAEAVSVKPASPPTPVSIEEKFEINKLYDEFTLAMAIMKAELITTVTLKPIWGIHSINEIIDSNLKKIQEYKLSILTLKTLDGRAELFLFIKPSGIPVGFKGRIEGVEYRGSGKDFEKITVLLYDVEIQARLWGLRELP